MIWIDGIVHYNNGFWGFECYSIVRIKFISDGQALEYRLNLLKPWYSFSYLISAPLCFAFVLPRFAWLPPLHCPVSPRVFYHLSVCTHQYYSSGAPRYCCWLGTYPVIHCFRLPSSVMVFHCIAFTIFVPNHDFCCYRSSLEPESEVGMDLEHMSPAEITY